MLAPFIQISQQPVYHLKFQATGLNSAICVQTVLEADLLYCGKCMYRLQKELTVSRLAQIMRRRKSPFVCLPRSQSDKGPSRSVVNMRSSKCFNVTTSFSITWFFFATFVCLFLNRTKVPVFSPERSSEKQLPHNRYWINKILNAKMRSASASISLCVCIFQQRLPTTSGISTFY